MKHLTLLLLGLTMLTHVLTAQISLDSMSYPETEVGIDSLKVTTASSAFPALTPLAGGTWDLSSVTDSTPVLFAYRVPTTAPYQFADSNLYDFAGFNYPGNVEASILSSAIFEYGMHFNKIGFSISPFTSGPEDSLIIDSQYAAYSSPRRKIEFPASLGANWVSNYHVDIGIHLSYLLLGDTSTPGSISRYFSERDSVVGWGKMSIKDEDGSPSVQLDVLQVQTLIISTDSFFLKGTPSSTFPDIFNLIQGHQDTIYEQNYYRQQEITPLAQVEFRDAAYTQPYKATTHVQRLQNTGIPESPGGQKIKVFPNPVSGHTLFVGLPAGNAAWTCELSDMPGRTLAAYSLPGNSDSSAAMINLPAEIQPGIYFLKLSSHGQYSVTPVEIDR